jgi:hypothetical protein
MLTVPAVASPERIVFTISLEFAIGMHLDRIGTDIPV